MESGAIAQQKHSGRIELLERSPDAPGGLKMRVLGGTREKNRFIAGKQVGVPVEGCTELRVPVTGDAAIGAIYDCDGHVELGVNFAIDRGVILNRVGFDNYEAAVAYGTTRIMPSQNRRTTCLCYHQSHSLGMDARF
jgi:hypothetical protein